MKAYQQIIFLPYMLFCIACSPIIPNIKHQYTLASYSTTKYNKQPHDSILINKPTTASGYSNNEMLYIKKPYELVTFAHNAWIDNPANMLLTLMDQSLQASNRFKTVITSPMTENTTYRLDSQLINIYQNFITEPSTLNFTVKLILINVQSNQIISSQIFKENINCSTNTPYGGVLAANQATKIFTDQMIHFVINNT